MLGRLSTREKLGVYALLLQYPQSASRVPRADFMPELAGQDIPTLIIKGQCDYLSWSSAAKYVRTLPEAQLIYLDGAGHNAYQDEPKRYMKNVRMFLTNNPLPKQPYTKDGPPDGYEGPR